MEQCTEELNDSVTTIEFFNAHIKHLLLDESKSEKFEQHSQKIKDLDVNVTAIKDQLSEHTLVLNSILSLKKGIEESNNIISEKMSHFQQEIVKLSQKPKCECTELITTISAELAAVTKDENSSILQTKYLEKMSGMQNNIAELSEKISSVQAHTQNLNPFDSTTEISALKQQLSELLARPSCPDPSLASTFSTDRLDSLSQQLDKLSSDVSAIQVHQPNDTNQPPELANEPQPNTTSPHLRMKPVQQCEPFTLYAESVIPEDLKESLTGLMERMEDSFVTVGTDNSRDVLYFGEYNYRYSGGQHSAKDIPDEVQQLIATVRSHLPNPDMKINSCLVSRYVTGVNSIPPHRDDEPAIDPESDIITVSIGAERKMTFVTNDGSTTKHQTLSDSSLLVSSRYVQDHWLHSIDPCECSDVRYSFTLRHVDPHFINSTILLGDSNTLNVKFGTGVGTLGAWMPGKRVKVGHIAALPKPSEIGPYRNIIIHTGINSINCSFRFKKSNQTLINDLENKLQDICDAYPKAKIFISLLLPSRDSHLNRRIHDFNNLLLDMTYRLNRVAIIEHSLFGDVLSNEHGRWKRSDEGSDTFVPNLDDLLHLGKAGMRLFASSLKQAVVNKNKSQSQVRYSGSRGGYRRAVVRDQPHRGGYQPQ